MRSATKCPNCSGNEFSFLRGPLVTCSGCSTVLQADNHPPLPPRPPLAVIVAVATLERDNAGLASICPRSRAEQLAIDQEGAIDAWMVVVGRDKLARFVDAEGVVSTEWPAHR